MLGFDDEYPVAHPKVKFSRFSEKNRKKTVLKHME